MTPPLLPNDWDTTADRLKRTIINMEAAEAAMEFTDGKDLAAIQTKNERRKDSIRKLSHEIIERRKSQFKTDDSKN